MGNIAPNTIHMRHNTTIKYNIPNLFFSYLDTYGHNVYFLLLVVFEIKNENIIINKNNPMIPNTIFHVNNIHNTMSDIKLNSPMYLIGGNTSNPFFFFSNKKLNIAYLVK